MGLVTGQRCRVDVLQLLPALLLVQYDGANLDYSSKAYRAVHLLPSVQKVDGYGEIAEIEHNA